jgi:hypothetical protein
VNFPGGSHWVSGQCSQPQTQKNRLKVGLCISLRRQQRDGTSGRTRTATLIQQRILNPSCLPIPSHWHRTEKLFVQPFRAPHYSDLHGTRKGFFMHLACSLKNWTNPLFASDLWPTLWQTSAFMGRGSHPCSALTILVASEKIDN